MSKNSQQTIVNLATTQNVNNTGVVRNQVPQTEYSLVSCNFQNVPNFPNMTQNVIPECTTTVATTSHYPPYNTQARMPQNFRNNGNAPPKSNHKVQDASLKNANNFHRQNTISEISRQNFNTNQIRPQSSNRPRTPCKFCQGWHFHFQCPQDPFRRREGDPSPPSDKTNQTEDSKN